MSAPDVAALDAAIDRFVAWLDEFGETSFDHQSYYAGRLGGAAKTLYYRRPGLGTLAVAPMVLSEAFAPSARRFFGARMRFPIADAHYAMAFAALAAAGDGASRVRAVHFLEVLERTRAPGYRRHGWGYPFDWVTRNGVMKAGTPLITTTPYAFEAFLAVYELDGDPRWLTVLQSIAEHALHDIPVREVGPDADTAGYNPDDRVGGVVNASAYRAFLLARAGVLFDRPDYCEAARRNLNYVLQAQRPDGSWFYATDGVRDFVDHFHTCFVLKALAKVEQILPDARRRRAIDAGVEYYVQHLFDADGLPRPFARAPRLTVYRNELYDYAECLNLGTLLGDRHPALRARCSAAAADLLRRWQKPGGAFRSRRLMLGWDDVPMHRWAQSQVFRSLCLMRLPKARYADSGAATVPTVAGVPAEARGA